MSQDIVGDGQIAISKDRAENIDDRFAENRIKFALIIGALLGREQEKVDKGVVDENILERIRSLLELDQLNRLKVAQLTQLAPMKGRRLLHDKSAINELKKIRDTDNFPVKGPKGPRGSIADAPSTDTASE